MSTRLINTALRRYFLNTRNSSAANISPAREYICCRILRIFKTEGDAYFEFAISLSTFFVSAIQFRQAETPTCTKNQYFTKVSGGGRKKKTAITFNITADFSESRDMAASKCL